MATDRGFRFRCAWKQNPVRKRLSKSSLAIVTMRFPFVVLAAIAATYTEVSLAFSPAALSNRLTTRPSSSGLCMAIDYNDPVVAAEFAKVQPMTFEEVEEELQASGIPYSQTMNDMEIKLMLVEVRMMLDGKLDTGASKKQKPATFSSKFEEFYWTKPAVADLFDELKEKDDHNSQNVMTEYLNNRDQAVERYGKSYKGLLRRVERALTAAPPVKSPTIKFSGFPANMGEDACRITLEAVGPVSSFSCETDDDFPILRGEVTFEDIETAKKAVEQYNGMDMGMGTALELVSVETSVV